MNELFLIVDKLGLPLWVTINSVLTLVIARFLKDPFLNMIQAWCKRFTTLDEWFKTCVFCGHTLFVLLWVFIWYLLSRVIR